MGMLKRIAAFGITKCRVRRTLSWFTVRKLFVLNCAMLVLIVLFYLTNKAPIPSSREVYVTPPLDSSSDDHFMPALDAYDRAIIDMTFKALTEAMDLNNVTFFVFGGTLLGSWRHHGLIPWDDDIDVMFNVTAIQAVGQVLRSKVAEDPESFGLYESAMTDKGLIDQWKFSSRNGRGLNNNTYYSPFIDIFFYLENETHIWSASPEFVATDVWVKSDVFPLRRRPFGNIMVPAPCNPESVLGVQFNLSVCESRYYNHLLDVFMPSEPIKVLCSRLEHLYPFVHRTSTSNEGSAKFVLETLKFRNATLGRFKAETCY